MYVHLNTLIHHAILTSKTLTDKFDDELGLQHQLKLQKSDGGTIDFVFEYVFPTIILRDTIRTLHEFLYHGRIHWVLKLCYQILYAEETSYSRMHL